MSEKVEFNPIKGVGRILFIVFLVLKLTGLIDWSWWWVTSPIWIPLACIVGLILIIGIVVTFAAIILKLIGRDIEDYVP